VNLNLGLFGRAAVVVIWIAAAFVVLSDRNDTSPPAAKAHQTKPTTELGTTTSPQQNILVSPVLSRPAKLDLAHRVQGFTKAYYLIRPADTTQSRRQRVSPFVTASALSLLDLGLSSGTAANNARVSHLLTQSGIALLDELEAGQSADDPAQWIVTVPVAIKMKVPSGQLKSSYTIHTASQWKRVNGRWYLVDFDKGGGDAG
jgi:hypothetical protein